MNYRVYLTPPRARDLISLPLSPFFRSRGAKLARQSVEIYFFIPGRASCSALLLLEVNKLLNLSTSRKTSARQDSSLASLRALQRRANFRRVSRAFSVL